MDRHFLCIRSIGAAIAGATIAAIVLCFGTSSQAEPIRGAGSTFAAPVIAAWSQAYRDARVDGGDFISPDWTVDYELVGSLAGVMRLDQPELDFAATDVPVNPADLKRHGREQFPIVFGSVAVVANIDGFENGRLAAFWPGAGRHLSRQDQVLVRPGHQGAQPGCRPTRSQDQRALPQGWFRNDFCLYRVSVGRQCRLEKGSMVPTR